MEIELNNEQTTPSQQQEQRKASHDLAAARLVKICHSNTILEFAYEQAPESLTLKNENHVSRYKI